MLVCIANTYKLLGDIVPSRVTWTGLVHQTWEEGGSGLYVAVKLWVNIWKRVDRLHPLHSLIENQASVGRLGWPWDIEFYIYYRIYILQFTMLTVAVLFRCIQICLTDIPCIYKFIYL